MVEEVIDVREIRARQHSTMQNKRHQITSALWGGGHVEVGLLFTLSDPLYIGSQTEDAETVILSIEENCMFPRQEEIEQREDATAWLTMSKTGWPIGKDSRKAVKFQWGNTRTPM